MAEPKNILIIRVSAIGDVVFASPLIRALRKRYPEARLSWLVEPPAASLLQHHPELDQVIIWPKQQWKGLWRERRWGELWRTYREFKKMLRAQQFDWVIDLQGLLKSGWLARMTGAPRRTGLGSKEGSARLMTEVVFRDGASPRISSEYYSLARELGLDVSSFEMEVALSPADEAFADQVALSKSYAVICPFTTRPQKHWVEARWPELAKQISEEFGLKVVMLGGPADVEAAARIGNHDPEIIDMVGQSSLTQTAALIKHASLLVGVDTGLTHMGIAYNVPTLALFGSTCPYQDTTRTNARVIYHKFDCSPCRRNPTCDGRFDCMAAITVAEIISATQEITTQE